MFKEIGQLAGLMKNLPKMKEEMEKLKSRMSQIVAEGDAGAGMVKVKVNGEFELLACTLSDEAAQLNDKELIEDLITAAVNQAMKKARAMVAEETGKMAAEMGLPSLPGGFNLPGLG